MYKTYCKINYATKKNTNLFWNFETLSFDLVQLFDLTLRQGPAGWSKACFQVCLTKVTDSGVLHKTKIVSEQET